MKKVLKSRLPELWEAINNNFDLFLNSGTVGFPIPSIAIYLIIGIVKLLIFLVVARYNFGYSFFISNFAITSSPCSNYYITFKKNYYRKLERTH